MNRLAIIIYIATVLWDTCSGRPRDGDKETILQSPRVTYWGNWGKLETCSPGFLVTGFQLKVKAKADKNDNTALNGVRFSCGVGYRQEYIDMARIMSSYGRSGTAREWQYCYGYAVGFQLKSQKKQGRSDDVAAINLKIFCNDEDVLEGYDEKEDYYKDSDYTNKIMCPEKTGICGLQTQVDSSRWIGDDTSLNNIRIKCCNVPNVMLTTTSTEKPTTTHTETSSATETTVDSWTDAPTTTLEPVADASDTTEPVQPLTDDTCTTQGTDFPSTVDLQEIIIDTATNPLDPRPVEPDTLQ